VSHFTVLEQFILNLMLVMTLVFGAIGFLYLWAKGHDLIEKHGGPNQRDGVLTIYHIFMLCMLGAAGITGWQLWT
jgi:hypothetical protein